MVEEGDVMGFKFGKWKKQVKKVHKQHVNNLIILNNPTASEKKKANAKARLESLEYDEFNLENFKNYTYKRKK